MTTVSTKPYLLRAIWEWCVDQGFTPYLAARVDGQTRVPPGYARDGQIVLNLSPDATGQLQMSNDYIDFQARFGGVAHSLSIPVDNVMAIYARENGQGMAFEIFAEEESNFAEDESGGDAALGGLHLLLDQSEAGSSDSAQDAQAGEGDDGDPDAPVSPRPRRGRPKLTVVK